MNENKTVLYGRLWRNKHLNDDNLVAVSLLPFVIFGALHEDNAQEIPVNKHGFLRELIKSSKKSIVLDCSIL